MEQHPDTKSDGELGFIRIETLFASQVTSRHYVPREEFVHSTDIDGSCVCGPWRVDGPMVMYRHYPLDQRYYDEGLV